ncbi:toprim domain-containing protein [Candidatus Igneacidithiobacillus taiwanensis]|uniref:toprim domain-containing protein n=1 Tax=Candidatus Igneacidithiobacillus taiwanensis TaxID=1945924 RepID=UPI0028A0CE24|nr:toprim domain-containing protein [Candidatus Igneacidithiobacillus taiwanensis]
MSDIIEQFRAALADTGVILHPSESIRADGVLHRARSADDKPGKLSCWYRLHLDAPPSGAGGDWRTGARLTWCSKRLSSLTPTEREALRERIRRERAEAEAETRRRHAQAAARAAWIWDNAKPASAGHPYLVHKQIPAGIARESRGALILPLVDLDGALHGLQLIDENGGKKFLPGTAKKGHYLPVTGTLDDSREIYLVEGWATGAAVASMRPSVQVAAAGDAGNLLPLALAIRERWPSVSLVIAGDFDEIGRQKAHDAAVAARARILPPPAEIPAGASDWNDIFCAKRQGVKHG